LVLWKNQPVFGTALKAEITRISGE
jgi:hypothetical protein